MSHVGVAAYVRARLAFVAAAQDGAGRRGLRGLGVGEADVAVQPGDQALRVVGVDGIEEVGGVRVQGIHRGAADLAAAEDPFLLSERHLLPLFNVETDDTHDLVGTARLPAVLPGYISWNVVP